MGAWGCHLGRGAGKRRLLAIANYLNQSLLRPLINCLMPVLKAIPMDGTFNQTAPLKRLAKLSVLYSLEIPFKMR